MLSIIESLGTHAENLVFTTLKTLLFPWQQVASMKQRGIEVIRNYDLRCYLKSNT